MEGYRKVSILIAVFNERNTIGEIIERVKAATIPNVEKEIVVVDDGSIDGTTQILKGMEGIIFVAHEKNCGKGAAIKTAIAHATGQILLLQDADLEYDPRDYASLVLPIMEGRADLVMGSRFLHQKLRFFTENGNPFFTHYVGNLIITWFTNLLFRQKMTDYEGCYKAFTRVLVDSVKIEANRFAFDNELVCKSIPRGYKIF